MRVLLFAAAALAACGSETTTEQTLTGEPPIVIAHRGASGERPEHTVPAFEIATARNADYLEPDVVMTKDGYLVVRHERYLSTTTDVASRPDYADKKRLGVSNGEEREDWWVEDMTIGELRRLRAIQPREGRSKTFDKRYPPALLSEVLVVASLNGVGAYPEMKEPHVFEELGLDPEGALLAALSEQLFDRYKNPIDQPPAIIQSFDPDFLKSLSEKTEKPLVQLVYGVETDTGLQPNVSLDEIATYADGVGPAKSLIIGPDGKTTDFVKEAHALGLFVHAWTFRDDEAPADGVDIETELQRIYAAGVDGVFADFPQTAVDVRAGVFGLAETGDAGE
ncbi:MAG: glycerophosphodiester phosphodiesterase family protein [Pseudomonadota bacterium]